MHNTQGGHGVGSRPRERRARRRVLGCLGAVGAISTALVTGNAVSADADDGTTTVQVFRTFTDAGVADPALDVPQAGIVVTLTDPTGGAISEVTDAAGAVTFDSTPLAGGRYRVDVSIPPELDHLLPAHARSADADVDRYATHTSFVDVRGGADATLQVAVWNPSDFVQPDPPIAVATQVSGYVPFAILLDPDFKLADGRPATVAPEDVNSLRILPWTTRGLVDTPEEQTPLNEQAEVGTTYGLAYDRHGQRIFQAAFAKSTTNYSEEGPGAIFVTGLDGVTSLFAVVPNAGDDNHGVDPLGDDDDFYGRAGKESLGGMAVSEDGNTLYVVNLNDRTLHAYDARAATGGTSTVIPAGNPTVAACADQSDWRPGAVTEKDGVLYVGGVCSAESTDDIDDLTVVIQRWTGAVWEIETAHPLNRLRGQILTYTGFDLPAGYWLPWSSTYDPARIEGGGPDEGFAPEPWLGSFVFDRDGSIILGFRDRFSDMTVAVNEWGHDSGGDINKLCRVGPDYVWEGDPGCPVSGLVPPGQDPNVVEYFGGDYFADEFGQHFETSQGALALPLRYATVVSTNMDPIGETFETGLGWYDLTDGTGPGDVPGINRNAGDPPTDADFRGATILRQWFATEDGTTTVPSSGFGKGNGLSALAVLADLAPVQIGNRVWIDADQNGQQDGDEDAVPGVLLELRDPSGTVLATTTTDSHGEYYFDVDPDQDVVVVVVGSNFQPGGPLAPYAPTTPNIGADGSDSDGTQAEPRGDFVAPVTVGGPGANDHRIDFGVYLLPPEPTTTVSTAPATTAGPTTTLDPAPPTTPAPPSTPSLPAATPAPSSPVVTGLPATGSGATGPTLAAGALAVVAGLALLGVRRGTRDSRVTH